MERRQGAFSDGISRILGIFGILIATGGSLFLYKENQQLKQQIKTVNDTIGTSQAAKDFNTNWNDQLVTALEEFKGRANEAIERDNQAIAARNRQFRDELAKLSLDTLETGDVEAIVDRKLQTLAKVVVPDASPQLRVARNVMKPGDASDANVAVIANDGPADAEVKLVSFRPSQNGQFEADGPLQMGSDSGIVGSFGFCPSTTRPPKRIGIITTSDNTFLEKRRFPRLVPFE